MITRVIGQAKGFYDVARYLKKDRETGADRDTGFRMGYNVSPDTMEAAREMAETSQGRLMHQACLHAVLSPAQAEGTPQRISPADLDQMVGDLIREMGWQDYQVLAVEHLDTEHQHVHLMINRAHPLDAGESIDGYYLYKDLRRWAQDFEARQQDEVIELGDPVHEQAEGGREHAAGDRPPSAREQRQGLEAAGHPSGDEQPGLVDLRTLSEKNGLSREVLALAELERLANEQEIALALLRADALQREATGTPLLTHDERQRLAQTAHELDVVLEREQRWAQEEMISIRKEQPAHPGDGIEEVQARMATSTPDLHERIAQRYRDLIAEARPYWMHAEAAVRDMKDLSMLRGYEEVTLAIRHEPEALGERTKAAMTEGDSERVLEAYHRYEAVRRQYVAEATSRLGLRAEVAPALENGTVKLGGPIDAVEQAEQLFFRDVAVRMLQERIQVTQGELQQAATHAARLSTSIRERANHHLYAALRETYKDPAEAFRRLEAYHRRGQADLVARRPELLGEMNRRGLTQRIRGDSPRKRAEALMKRYGKYVKGLEANREMTSAALRVEHLQERLQVLRFVQQRIGTREAIQQGYEEVHKRLSPGERLRLDIRLEHLPGTVVRRRSERLVEEGLRAYPGAVRPGHARNLVSDQVEDRAIGKAAGAMGRKMGIKRPLRLAMKASRWTRGTTNKIKFVYQAARTFFER